VTYTRTAYYDTLYELLACGILGSAGKQEPYMATLEKMEDGIRQLSKLTGTDSVKCVAGTTQDISNLVSNKLFDFCSSWAKVFARIKLFWRFPHRLSNRGSHCEPEISVDVYFGATKPPGDFDVSLRNTRRVFSEFASVPVDLLNEVFWNAGGSVEHERIVTHTRIQ